jgi:hypothetical protein
LFVPRDSFWHIKWDRPDRPCVLYCRRFFARPGYDRHAWLDGVRLVFKYYPRRAVAWAASTTLSDRS